MTLTRSRAAAGVFLAGLLLSSCSDSSDPAEDTKSTDLCTEIDGLFAAADDLRAMDTAQATAEEVQDRAEAVRDNIDQVQAVAEGRLAEALSALETVLDDLRSQLAEAGEDARDALEQLVEKDLAAVAEQMAIVRERIEEQCS